MKEIAIEELRRQLDYNPETGEITRKIRTTKTEVGDVAGYLNKSTGYLMLKVKGQTFKAHRVCWAIYHGYWSTVEIGHINHNKADNRLVNLREATHFENLTNRIIPSNNKSGVIGVGWYKLTKKWRATICIDGKNKTIGYFKDFEEAKEARLAAEAKLGYHYNHGKDV
jgi:hypothetical protein